MCTQETFSTNPSPIYRVVVPVSAHKDHTKSCLLEQSYLALPILSVLYLQPLPNIAESLAFYISRQYRFFHWHYNPLFLTTLNVLIT